jgi:NAD(P)-dependent dehydrogenase (short-subunit alcohol dehydrogenase family)
MATQATYNFSDKAILITGGAGDIGRATAQRFAANGAGVVLVDLNEVKLADVAQELKSFDVPVVTLRCDVTSSSDVAHTFTEAAAQLKPGDRQIDYVFNNAGYQEVFATTDEYPEDDFQKVIEINVLGFFTY